MAEDPSWTALDRPTPLSEDLAMRKHRNDRRYRHAEDTVAEIDNMLDSKKFRFAIPTLEGIRETIERTGYATPGQVRAINNIRRSMGWEPVEEA